MPPRRKPAAPAAPQPAAQEIELRGANGELFNSTEPEVIDSGPADTGKSVACCLKVHAVCSTIPGAQCAIARKTYNSIAGSVFQTYNRVIQPAVRGIEVFGGQNRPERLIYPNGSVVWMAGLDDPGKSLSSERDLIFVCQAEQLTLNDWEMLTRAVSGRGAKVKHAQLVGDCNPGGSKHWIRARAAEGKLRLLVTRHQDNPDLYDAAGNLTEEGAKRLAVLQNLSGVRRLRLLEGVWATAEGAVYDLFNATRTGQPSDHVCERDPVEMRQWILTHDIGITDPAVVLLVGVDSDHRWHVYREFYERGRLQEEVTSLISQWYKAPLLAAMKWSTAAIDEALSRGPIAPRAEMCVVDAANPGVIMALQAKGVNAKGGKGVIEDGIQRIRDRLQVRADGRPRLTVDPSCVNTMNEFESYVWKPERDVPVDKDNHAMDALRYIEDVLAVPSGAITSGMVVNLATGTGTTSSGFGGRTWPGRTWPGR